MFLSVEDVQEDTVIAGHPLSAAQLKDINRGRAYLRQVAKEHGTLVFDSVADTVKAVIQHLTSHHTLP